MRLELVEMVLLSHSMLPVELVDHVFSFLRGDIPALEACLQANPAYSALAERYLYADIVIQTNDDLLPEATHSITELYERFSKNPHLLYYPRTLEIDGCLAVSGTTLAVLSFIAKVPRMANLSILKFSKFFCCCQRPTGPCDNLLRDCLSQLSIEELCLRNFYNISLSILDNGKDIKKLTLSDCTAKNEPMSNLGSHSQSLESLVIDGERNAALLSWAMRRVSRGHLTSLELRRTASRYEWSVFPELLMACSSSLRTLYVDVGVGCMQYPLYAFQPLIFFRSEHIFLPQSSQ
jgi:hypothetical protein